MSHPTFPRLLDPLVAKNPYRKQRYRPEEIMPFSRARGMLPRPILPEHKTWEEMYWRAWEIAWQHLHQPRPASGFVANFSDSAFNENLFMWDSAFISLFGVYARRAFDFTGTLDNFYAKQHNDGFICREINQDEGYDFFFPHDPNGTGPNVLAWTEWRLFRHTRDEERIARVFWPLMALHRWFRSYRTWPTGLYWATGLSSGMDNQPRVPAAMLHHQHWTWVDATIQASVDCWALSQMAGLLGEKELVDELAEERAFLMREINARLWSEETRFYHDVDPAGVHSPVKSIAAYWALLDKDLVPEDRLSPFVRHLYESEEFNRPHRVPSQSADSPGYEEDGGYWRGGVWPPTNYMLLKGLRSRGWSQLAYQIALNDLENTREVFQHTDTFWENYAPERPVPGEPAKPDFVGWSGLSPIAVLLEDIVGISVDWPLRRVTWDRRLEGGGRYGVRNYPLGQHGTMSLVGDSNSIEVESDVPFNLTITEGDETLQTAISQGTLTITR